MIHTRDETVQRPMATLGRSRLGSFFLASMCTVLPFSVSSTASTTLSICVTPASVCRLAHCNILGPLLAWCRLDLQACCGKHRALLVVAMSSHMPWATSKASIDHTFPAYCWVCQRSCWILSLQESLSWVFLNQLAARPEAVRSSRT